MLLFAHIGITLGVDLAGHEIYARLKECVYLKAGKKSSSQVKREEAPEVILRNADSLASPYKGMNRDKPIYDFARGLFDFRFWIIGSILPDVIDKPIGHFLFSQTFGNNGRIFSHTLLLFILLLGAGLYLAMAKKKMGLLALSLGVLMHLVLDSMWQTPQTLFWPLLGWRFPVLPDNNWVGSMLQEYFHDPAAYIPELIGIPIIGGFVWRLIRNKRVKAFLWKGYY